MSYDVILVDSKNAVYRHGYTRALLTNSSGKPTGAIFGILSCLIRLHNFHPKAKFIFCWDGKETFKSWRHTLCDTYKANRAKKPGELPVEVKSILSQIPAIKKVITLLGFPQYEIENLEADDLLGILSKTLSKRKDVNRVLIYSMDKDCYQLIGDKVGVVRDLDKSAKCEAFTAIDVEKKFGVHPKNWNKYRALVGDVSDGIKSPFPKVGKVRALKLLAEGLDPSNSKPTSKLEKEYSQFWEQAHTNYRLSKIVTNPTHSVLTERNILHLKKVVKDISTDKGIKRQNRKDFNNVGARAFVKFCGDYELNWILENRHIFYSMGW